MTETGDTGATADTTEYRHLSVIGIGAGDPNAITLHAAQRLGEVDVVLLLTKRDEVADLGRLRDQLIAIHASPDVRIISIDDPVRDPALPYQQAVAEWHAERARLISKAITTETVADERLAMLAWGDPSLYDSTLRIIERVNARSRAEAGSAVIPLEIDVEVIAGVSSLHLLTAAHRIPLNRVGKNVLITTGRCLARDAVNPGVDDLVVFLDGQTAFTELSPDGWHIYWGAYLGAPHQILIDGPLHEAGPVIVQTRAEARLEHGWMFDTYLLRRTSALSTTTSPTTTSPEAS